MEVTLSSFPPRKLNTAKMKRWTVHAFQRELRALGWADAAELPDLTPKMVREIRLEMGGISQDTLAALLNTTPTTVYRWEAGKSKPEPFFKAGLHFLLAVYRRQGV